jgi:hypothetical protein
VWQKIKVVLKRRDNKAVKNIEGELLGYMVRLWIATIQRSASSCSCARALSLNIGIRR